MATTNEIDHERFLEIKDEIECLANEAIQIVPRGFNRDRAKAYWYGQIMTALSKNSDFIGSSMCTMEDTANEIDPGEEDEEISCSDCGGIIIDGACPHCDLGEDDEVISDNTDNNHGMND